MSRKDRRTIYSVLIVTLAVVLGLLIGGGTLQSYDVWWHLVAGQDTIANGAIRVHDIYSHTAPGAYRAPQQWLFEVIQAGFYAMAGVRGMIGLRALLAVGILGFVAIVLLRRNCSYLLVAGLLPLIASAGLPSISCRPHMVLPIFLLAIAVIGLASRKRPEIAWIMPLLFIPWTNLHASFMLGLAFVGLWAVQRTFFADPDNPWKFSFSTGGLAQSAGVILASIAACAINPVGPELLLYPLEYLPGGELAWHSQYIQEWQMPSLWQVERLALLIMIVVGLLTAIFGWRKMTPFELLILALMVFLGMRWKRSDMQSAVIIAFVAAPVISQWLQSASPQLVGLGPKSRGSAERILPVALVVVTVLGVVSILRPVRLKHLAFQDIYPEQMATWALNHDLEGKMYNPLRWGGYLIHRLYPRYRVFIDGRIDMYPREAFEDARTLRFTYEGWEEIAKKHGIEWGMVRRSEDLFNVIQSNDRWVMVLTTNTGGLFVRRAGPNRHFGEAPEANGSGPSPP